ncbi:TonB-dependent receptor [Balneicella halophila]|uniref:hypothetical protein n=1 Tax=Balneicella halophila TaxID=1537566 RepID=UPI000E2FF9D6|nr:hypothetical protein [Balneicella halophila]
MQQKNLPNLKSFHTKDIGCNVHYKLGKRVEINSYNYLVSEDFKVNVHSLNYSGEANAKKKRFFSVNNLNYYTPKGVLSVNTGICHSNQDLNYGSIESKKKVQQIYTSVNFKSQLSDKINLQTGISYDCHKNRFNDSIPIYPFAMAPEDPKELSKDEISKHMADIYAYSDYAMSDKLSFSAALRANIPINNQTQRWNAQFGMKYNFDEKQSVMMSLGNYES